MKNKEIRKCRYCKMYTFKEICLRCKNKTFRVIPPKFSPEDKWGDYRRKNKREYLYKLGYL
ncbi:MAG: nucleolar RNA-binding Nop10p family protein [Nanoarchaeales archaeon]